MERGLEQTSKLVTRPSPQGLALGSTSFYRPTGACLCKLVDAKAKPWHDDSAGRRTEHHAIPAALRAEPDSRGSSPGHLFPIGARLPGKPGNDAMALAPCA